MEWVSRMGDCLSPPLRDCRVLGETVVCVVILQGRSRYDIRCQA